MRIGVLRERAPLERRVALVPATVQRLIQQKHEVLIEQGAGVEAFYPDHQYASAGARVVGDAAAVAEAADLVVKVQRPMLTEVPVLRSGSALASLLAPHASAEVLDALARQ